MRGEHREESGSFSYVSLEDRIPKRHPVRNMRKLVDSALVNLDELFDEIFAHDGRPSISPERPIRTSLLQVLYSIRSERQLVEQIYLGIFMWLSLWLRDTPLENSSRS